MNYKGHIAVGLGTIGLLLYLNTIYMWAEVTPDLFWQILIIAGVYALMPDIDQPGAKINKAVTFGLGALAVYSFINTEYSQYGIPAVIIIVLLRFIEHRTIIHSLLGAVVVAAPLWYFFSWLHFVVGVIAYITHLIIDGEVSLGWEKDWW